MFFFANKASTSSSQAVNSSKLKKDSSVKPIAEMTQDPLSRQLQFIEAKTKAAELQQMQYFLEAKINWYKEIISFLEKFQKQSVKTKSDKENLFERYNNDFKDLIERYLHNAKVSFANDLKEHISLHVVNDHAVKIIDDDTRNTVLNQYMENLKNWTAKKCIIFDDYSFNDSALTKQLLQESKVVESERDETKNLCRRYQLLVDNIKRQDEGGQELLRIADRIIQELDKEIQKAKDESSIISKGNSNAGALLELEVKSRSFSEYKSLFINFMQLLDNNEEYIKEYTNNKFLQRATDIIKRYTLLAQMREEHWFWSFVSSIKDNTEIKEQRYGEVEAMLLSFDLGISDKVGQEQINELLSRLAEQAKRGGLIYPTTGKNQGRSYLHDDFDALLKDIRRHGNITQFRKVYELNDERVSKIEKENEQLKKDNAGIKEELSQYKIEQDNKQKEMLKEIFKEINTIKFSQQPTASTISEQHFDIPDDEIIEQLGETDKTSSLRPF